MSSDLAIIETLEDEIGKDLGQLEQINFRTPISGYVIDDNENNIELSIYHKDIKNLSVLKKLNKLTKLYLKYNEIKDYSELKELKNLTLLDLSFNQITDLSVLKELKNLTQLYLSSNQITDLSVLKELKNLTQLYLSSNQITDLSVLKALKNLTQLYLSSNQITDLSVLKELKNLTQLYLSSNQITALSALKALKNLTQLDLSFNQITALSALKALKNLTQLYLSSNQITDLSVLKELKNLTQLYLSSNEITDLSALKELKNLTQLYLSSNEITDLSALKELKNLTQLDLSSNEITDLSALKELKNLTQLDLSSNEITDLSALKELKNLTQLDLSSNEITHLPSEIVDMGMDIKREGFSGIILANNPLEIPPIEIEKKGKNAVKAYFKSLKGEKRALNEVKVLLVGDGGAGKTSLVKQVLGEEFDKHEPQTQGIHLRDWKVGDIHVHFWDFGGQEIMHATHQFFLSKRSLYILVLDGRRDEKTEYWLKHIESFGGDSPILVVLNKIDENPSFEVNRRFLQEKYKGIKGFYRVSCAEREGFDVFTGALSKALANVELIKTSWPKTWFNVKTQLEAMTENFISIDEYKEMCTKEKITEKNNQDTLVDFLNDLGVILHFKDFELLDTHVLDPKWLTNAVYRIINSEKLAACNGVLKLDLLDVILKKEAEDDYYYPSGKYRYIIDLMKKFEMCYEIDKATVLLPDLLEVSEPEFDFDYDAALKFVIDYDFLPKSVMPRFIVKMHKDIKNGLQWRTGVVLENKDFHSTAVIKVDEMDEKIYIYVDGEQKRDYFSAIRKTFSDINASFERLEAKELVPLPDNDEITIEYEDLIGYEQMGREEFIVGKTRKEYSVSELLDGIEKRGERLKDFFDTYIKTLSQMTKIETQEQKIEFAKREETILLNSQDWKKHKDYAKINPLYEKAQELEKRGENKESIETYEKIIDINEYYIKAWEGLERNYNALGESEKKYSALKKIRSIKEFIDFATNAAQKIKLQQFNLQNLDFFDNLFWTFQPQINILLGKNGYGKTYLLRLLISLLQKDEAISSEFFKGSKKSKYLFSWEDVSRGDIDRPLRFLVDDLDIDWAENAEIHKSDDGKTIRIFKDENSAVIKIDEEKEKATLKISDDRSYGLKVKKEDGKLNIYTTNSFVSCDLERNNVEKVIYRTKTVFKESIGTVPVLAIPDMRLVDKSRTTIEKTILDTPIRASGAYHFLYEKPFDEVIQNFLYALCISMDKDKPFEQPLFQLLHKIVRKLADKEFKFDEIVAIGEKFEINVITEGNPEKPLSLQKASQGTLSVLSIFGLIYYFLTSVFPDTPEEELLKKPAIVFIDEIDAHLHPSWQQKIIGLLRENFPNVQFIVTAHSPLVVAGCYENEVAVLRKGKGGFTIEQFERDFIGYEAKELYQIIFDIEEKDETYLQYTALGLFKKGIESDISKLESKYLFSWDNVPGNDNEILLKSLKDDIDIDWAENAEIRKSDDGKTLRISKSENSAEILIDEKKEKATLKISGGRTHNLKVKKENSKLNIYESKTKVEKLSEDEKRKLHKLYKDLNYIGQTRKKYDERTQPSNLLIQNRRLKAEIEKLKRELIKNGVKYDRG